jgi:hypothetical protein
MSTDFETTKLIDAADLFDGRLAKHGVREHIPSNPRDRDGARRCLTDGEGGFLYVWCGSNEGHPNNRLHFTRYASNMANGSVMGIIDAIEKEFDTIVFPYDADDDIPDDIAAQIEPLRNPSNPEEIFHVEEEKSS